MRSQHTNTANKNILLFDIQAAYKFIFMIIAEYRSLRFKLSLAKDHP